ncbi:hypothetical protein PSU4_00390 [Pseudonocardia sulfidoxydans NBRC 16205]|uniref:Uncharacterized protein n=1 Tax=Pseudonocardia sulfidoxydans NBRC 16205 TaxID=1223511 RepID=A0A511D8F9_9PSEU|nr:hypothetical protein PSU4_00390 [Pseudonocardia sulfidoxydans NBRC 16205]
MPGRSETFNSGNAATTVSDNLAAMTNSYLNRIPPPGGGWEVCSPGITVDDVPPAAPPASSSIADETATTTPASATGSSTAAPTPPARGRLMAAGTVTRGGRGSSSAGDVSRGVTCRHFGWPVVRGRSSTWT